MSAPSWLASPFYFHLFFPVFSFHVLHSELYTEFDNLIVMENLCYSAQQGEWRRLRRLHLSHRLLPTTWPSASTTTLRIPPPTLSLHRTRTWMTWHSGKLLTEAHRGQADYCGPEGVSVSQSSSVVFDGSGKPSGERNVDQSVGFGVTRNTYSAHSKFSENTQAEKVVYRSGKPEERNSSNAKIRTLLEEQR